jgi:serine/threonine-protein kinase
MTLQSGTRFGAYEIVSHIGAGGMGEVYRAHDTNLGRDVAIKVLPDVFATDADRLARFEREARVLASLSHPNIAAIHGLDRSGSTACLVMEFATGETLAARIARGRLPVDDAIAIALQIAAALEAAHDKNVVHRDLKPANVIVSPDGRVKVLDFGLAKLVDPSASGAAHLDVSLSPTMAHVGTMAGVILGTAAYMSPEQARGKAVDKRADIWAFGSVVFEMLTGAQAFPGETLTDIVAAVVKNEPDWSLLPADVPRAVRRVLLRCLKKDPRDRFHDIADVRISLTEPSDDAPAAPAVTLHPRTTRTREIAAWTLAAISTATALALIGWRSAATRDPVARVELSLPQGVELFSSGGKTIVLSPDGRSVAFVGTRSGVRQIYLRRLDQSDATPVRGTEGSFTCFFSPDGSAIGFIAANGSLRSVSLADDLIATIAPSGADNTGSQTWGPDGRITFTHSGTLWSIPAIGGIAGPLTKLAPETGELAHNFPVALDNGVVLFTALNSKRPERIEAVSPKDGSRRVVVESAQFPLYASGGRLIFAREQGLFAAAFDARTLSVSGVPVRVVDRISIAATGAPIAALSQAGSLLYATGAAEASTLVWVSRRGEQVPVTATRRLYFGPRLSPDGRRIVVQASGDLWVLDLERSTFTRLTSSATFSNSFPIWTPDGKRVVFRTSVGIHWIDVDRTAATPQRIAGTTISDFPTSVSPDGDTLLHVRQTADDSGDVYALSLSGKAAPHPVVSTVAFEGGGIFSPDGRWIAYVSDESGQRQVYVRAVQGERRWPVSTAGGTSPVWNRNGRELFYRDGDKIMAVDVAAGAELTLSTPHLLFEHAYAYGPTITIPNYDVTPDGQRFLLVQDEAEARRFEFVLNWFTELQRLVKQPR